MTKFCTQCGKENEDNAKFCLACGEAFNTENKSEENNNAISNNNVDVTNVIMNKKSKGLAYVLSFFIPGLGYAYIKDYVKCMLIFIFAVILIVIIAYCRYKSGLVWDSFNNSVYTYYSYDDLDAWFRLKVTGYFFYFILWIVQLYTVGKATDKYNNDLIKNLN